MFRGFSDKSRACLHAFCLSDAHGFHIYSTLDDAEKLSVRRFFRIRSAEYCSYSTDVLEALREMADE